MRRSSKSKPTSPQVVAHHVDAHFLHGLLVLNVQHRLAAERLRFKGKIRILRAGIFGTAPALDAKALASLLAGKPSTTAKNKKAENL